MTDNGRIIAFCGLDCSACDAYLATQANDRAALEAVVATWRAAANAPDMQLEDIICDGCFGADGRRASYCAGCGIRVCAAEKGVSTCAACADYACERLEGLLKEVPEARANLEALRGATA